MFPSIEEIKQKRLKLGLKQAELAEKARVSQSLIAKLEAGRIEPSYSKIKSIFEALNSLEEKKEQKCFEVMNKKLIAIEKNATVKDAASLMRKKDISQIPIFHKHTPVGSVSESTILSQLDKHEREKLFSMKVEEIMEESFPIVDKDTNVKAIIPLLKNSPVLISSKGKVLGIITKANLL